MSWTLDRLLDYYTVTAERETGFWIGLQYAVGKTVARKEWLLYIEEDPKHFQLVTLTAEELTGYSSAPEDVNEPALFFTWSDEPSH